MKVALGTTMLIIAALSLGWVVVAPYTRKTVAFSLTVGTLCLLCFGLSLLVH